MSEEKEKQQTITSVASAGEGLFLSENAGKGEFVSHFPPVPSHFFGGYALY